MESKVEPTGDLIYVKKTVEACYMEVNAFLLQWSNDPLLLTNILKKIINTIDPSLRRCQPKSVI